MTDIIYIDVPFTQKDEAKNLGANWDANRKKWYIPSTADLTLFEEWLSEDYKNQLPKLKNNKDKKGISLAKYLNKLSRAVKEAASHDEWICAEISEIKQHNGHYYPTLIESDKNGNQIAKCRAIIWKQSIEPIIIEFQKQTGDSLKEGIKVLLYGKANMHPLYGLSIQIENIDPSYTVGNIFAKLNTIRNQLKKNKLYSKNKSIAIPQEFTKVAVISPHSAAGLGDFKKEADILAKHNLCQFIYYSATFQGKNAVLETKTQINQMIQDNQKNQYDVLIIIRGGGAITDLAWLNEYDIAEAICHSPIPVFSGIGHEKDRTIIDEVACKCFDTPSKVIKHIWDTIIQNARSADRNFSGIFKHINKNVQSLEEQLTWTFTNLLDNSLSLAAHEKAEIKYTFSNIFAAAKNCTQRLRQSSQFYIKELITNASANIHILRDSLLNIFNNQIISTCQNHITLDRKNICYLKQQILERTKNIKDTIIDKLENFMTIFDLLNPRKILERGFVLVRAKNGKVLPSKNKALKIFQGEKEFCLVFSDGKIMITSIDSENIKGD